MVRKMYEETLSQDNFDFIDFIEKELSVANTINVDTNIDENKLRTEYIEKFNELASSEFKTSFLTETDRLLFDFRLNELKQASPKMKQEFVDEYARKRYVIVDNKEVKLNRIQFSLLYAITPFVDLDFSISINLNEFMSSFRINSAQLKSVENYLIDAGLLVEKTGKLFVTQNSHTLVKPKYEDQKYKKNYVPNLSLMQDYRNVVKLNQNQHRFFCYLLANSVVKEKGYHQVLINRLYHNIKTENVEYARSGMKDFKDVVMGLAQLLTMGLIHFKLENRHENYELSYLINSNRDYTLEKAEDIYEEIINAVKTAGDIKHNFIGRLIEGMTVKTFVQISEEKQQKNVASFYSLEKMLTKIKPYQTKNIYEIPLVKQYFSNSEGLFNFEDNQANLFINAKKELAFVLQNSYVANSIIEPLQEQFIEDTKSVLQSYSMANKSFSQFKDFYLMKSLSNHIFNQIKLELLNQQNTLVDIDTDYITFNHIPSFISIQDFNRLIMYYSKMVNRHELINFMDTLKSLVTSFADQTNTDVEFVMSNMLMKKYHALSFLFESYYSKTQLLYKNFMEKYGKQDLDIQFSIFCEILPVIIRTCGLSNYELINKFVIAAQKEYNSKIAHAEVKNAVLQFEEDQIVKALSYSSDLLTLITVDGVYSEFFKEAKPIIKAYQDTILQSINFKTQDKQATAMLSLEVIDAAKKTLNNDLMLLAEYYGDTYENAQKFKYDADNKLFKLNKPLKSRTVVQYHDYMFNNFQNM